MKVLIPIMIGLLVVGCGNTEDSVVGIYEEELSEAQFKLRKDKIHEYETSRPGKFEARGTWEIINGEIVISVGGSVVYYRIKKNGDLTAVAFKDGKEASRVDDFGPNTWKKIK